MGCLDHWNAVALSRNLKKRPIAVRVDGHDIVVFRQADGAVAAVDEMCPHRRMKLSAGCVVDDRIQCAYHGWTFDACGAGESPGTPKMHAHTTSYEAREAYGLVWLRPRGCNAEFPEFDADGCYHLCTMEHTTKVPLELVLDNFAEIEHTATTHIIFGYELARMAEVKFECEADETTVRCHSSGPHKALPWLNRVTLGCSTDIGFVSDWSMHFSPVYIKVEHTLFDQPTGRRARIRYRAYVIMVPTGSEETKVFTVIYTKSTFPGPYGGIRLIAPWLRRMARTEIDKDCEALDNLADKRPGLEGLKLSRFDRVMVWNRERIDRVYRGLSDATSRTETPAPNLNFEALPSVLPGIGQSWPQ